MFGGGEKIKDIIRDYIICEKTIGGTIYGMEKIINTNSVK